jgi:hypothetical protein
MRNLIKTKFTPASRDAFRDLVTQLEAEAEGKLISLTEQERSRHGSVNEQNKLLINKTHDIHENQPNLGSPDVDWEEFESDYVSRGFLESMADRLLRLAHQLQSTKILHDSDNYQDALNDYAHAQYKKGAGEPGYAEKVAELKQFFARTGKKKSTDDKNNSPDEENNG